MDVGLDSVLVDRYELGATLGRGGMAEVRAAHDRRLDRPVAVKLFNSAAWSSPEGRARFETEAQLAASVTHPNVVVIYDVGIDGEVPFLVMECLPGTTLADEIRAGPLTMRRATTIATAILDALGAAHAQGVLHRDLKPANVLIAADGTAKLTDFGIATSDTLLELTAAGMVVGTTGISRAGAAHRQARHGAQRSVRRRHHDLRGTRRKPAVPRRHTNRTRIRNAAHRSGSTARPPRRCFLATRSGSNAFDCAPTRGAIRKCR
jgi:serine/threonine protein kinase